MKGIKRIAFLLIPVLLLSSCFGSREIKEEKTGPLSENEFMFDAYFLEGLRLKTVGDFEEALGNFEKAREYDAESAVLHYQLAEVNTQLGNYRAAIHYAENATGLDPDNVWYHVLLVQLYQNAGMLAKATGEMEEIIRLEPRRLEFYFMLSGLYQAIGEGKSAISTMNRAEKEFGVLDIISVEKETIYLDEGKTDKAIKEIESLIEAYPEDFRYQALMAELYLSVNQIGNAKDIYDKLAETDMDDGNVLLAMSEFYRGIREYDRSFDFLKRAFADEDLDLDLKIEMLVSVLTTPGVSKEELERQRELFDVLIKTHPTEPKAMTIYSDYLVKAGEYENARKIIREVLSTVRDKYLIWEQLLYINNHLLDFDALLSDSDTVIELFPVQPIPYLFNSLSAFQLNQNEKAIKSAETGLKYVADDKAVTVELMTFMGEANYRIKNYEASDSIFDEILRLDPENIYILNNYAYYLSLRGEKLEKAKTMGRKLIDLQPGNSSYLDTYGWVLYMMGEYEEAEEYVNKALQNGGSGRPAILEHYGDIMYRLGRKEEAVKFWKDAIDKSEVKPSEELKQKAETGEL